MDFADIDSSDVSVTVREGCVVLEGTVPVRSMKYEIEDIAATTLGVSDVENNIRVPGASRFSTSPDCGIVLTSHPE